MVQTRRVLPLDWLPFLLWAAYFTIPFFWFLVHPFAGFWRRHRGRTYAVYAVGIWLAFLAGFSATSSFWFAERFERTWPVVLAGFALISLELVLTRRAEGELGVPILIGWAERDPQQFPPRLVDSGIYRRVRHPRYLAAMSVLFGAALLTGAWRLIYMTVMGLPLYALLALLEERELLQRIGEPYRDYCRRVPRFIPRLRL